MPGPHKIEFFLGSSNTVVGSAGIFTDNSADGGGNRQLNFSVPLTAALVEQNIALRPEEAVPSLAGQLRWVVTRVPSPYSTPESSTTNPYF